jgi:hypothetical protein
MARLQEKGEIPEEQLRDLETDVTGKILLASWRGTRFEVISVLREVCVVLASYHTVPES